MGEVFKKKFHEWDFVEEEKWLNEMIQQGLVLKKVHGNIYSFEKCAPNEYQIKLEIINANFWNKKNQKYIKSIKESGKELVESTGRFNTTCRMYIKNKGESDDFKSYYDNKEKVKQSNTTLFNQFVIMLIWLQVGFNLNGLETVINNSYKGDDVLFLVIYLSMLVFLIVDAIKVLLVRSKFKELY